MNDRRRALVAVIAAIVGALLGVPGVGHAYLRQWRRAAAWFVFAVATLLLAVTTLDPATLESLATSDPFATSIADMPLVVVAPYYGLLTLSIGDAYLVARRLAVRRQVSNAATCPNCGREVDAGLSFCWYCAESRD